MVDRQADAGLGARDSSGQQKAKAPSPWSVRGVSREARAKAGKAAKRRRETLGEWVTNALTQIANEELGTGPRRAAVRYEKPGLPVSPADDESPLGKALLALATRFERSEKRNEAIAALAQRVENAESSGKVVGIMAERIGIVEQRSRALTLMVDRLESSEQREKALLSLMHGVAERAERSEERIATVTRGLSDLAITLETTLNKNSVQTAQKISNSLTPLEIAVNALGDRLSLAIDPQGHTAPQYDDSSGNARSEPQPYAAPATSTQQTAAPQPATPDASTADSEGQGDAGNRTRLKFDFHTLNKRAIENSQRLAHDPDAAVENKKSARGGWFGKRKSALGADQEDGEERNNGDWTSEYLAEDTDQSEQTDTLREPKLEEERLPRDEKPAVSEEDKMLMALKQAIKREKT